MSEQKLKVFLCHSSGDKPAVRELYNRLRLAADYISPWLDEEDLLPGQYWREVIPVVVRNSDVVIVCLSQGAINKSGYLQKEIKVALDVADEQPEGAIFLIPVRLEGCELPKRLADLHYVDLFEESGFDRLMRSLKSRAGKCGLDAGDSANTSNNYFGREPKHDSNLNAVNLFKAPGRLQLSNIILTYHEGRPRIHWVWEGWRESVHKSSLIIAATILKNRLIRQFTPPSQAKISLTDKSGLTVAEVNIHFTNDTLMFEYEGVYDGSEGFSLKSPTDDKMQLLWRSEFKVELIYEKVIATETSSKSYRHYLEMSVPYLAV